LPLPLPLPVPSDAGHAPATDHRAAIDLIYGRHPKKQGRMLYEQELSGKLGESVNPDALMEQISAGHEIWCESEDWTKESGKYAPKLANWIRDAGYLDAPPVTEEEYSDELPPPKPPEDDTWRFKSHFSND
jgi:hypothetical protein